MKRVIYLAVLIFSISFLVQARTPVLKGKTYCALGDFKIENAAEPFVLNGETLETFDVTYENSPKVIRIAVLKEKKCCRYLVLSDDLSVEYLRNKSYFGVAKHPQKMHRKGLETDMDAMNIGAYYHQKVITRDDSGKSTYLKLIAAYYPQLVRNYEKVFECI